MRLKYIKTYLCLLFFCTSLITPDCSVSPGGGIFAQDKQPVRVGQPKSKKEEEKQPPVRVGQPKSKKEEENPPPVTPESYKDQPGKPVAPRQEQGKITLQLRDTDIIEVLKILANEGNLNIVVSDGVKGKITVFLDNISVIDALDVIVETNDLAYNLEGNIVKVFSKQEYEQIFGIKFKDRLSMHVFHLEYGTSADANKALSLIKSSQGTLITDARTNTLTMIDIPEAIAKAKTIMSELDIPLETRVLHPKFVNVSELKELLVKIVSPGALLEINKNTNKIIITDVPKNVEKAVALIEEYDQAPFMETRFYALNFAKAEEIAPILKEELSAEIGIVYSDPVANQLIIKDIPENLDYLESIIKVLDVHTRQVLIEAKIIQVALTDKFKLGVNWEAINDKLNVKMNFKILEDNSTGGQVIGGILEEHDYTFLVETLETIGDTKILSSPRIAVVSGQEAKILVGSNVPYKTVDTIQDQGVINNFQKVTFIETGVKLFVTPTINEDGYIIMKIKPEVSSVTSFIDDIPVVETSESETTIMVKNGTTVILAGLIRDEKVKTVNRVPIIGRIPILGKAFSNTDESITQAELVIFLTPTIFSGEVNIQEENPTPKRD